MESTSWQMEKITFTNESTGLFLILTGGILTLLWILFRVYQKRKVFRQWPVNSRVSRGLRPLFWAELFLWSTGLLLLTGAWMRPRIPLRTIERETGRIPVVILLDLSASMQVRDMPGNLSRLDVARQWIAFFVQQIRGVEVAVVGFTSTGLMLVPPVTDVEVIPSLLEAVDPALLQRKSSQPAGALSVLENVHRMLVSPEPGEKNGVPRVFCLLLSDGEFHGSIQSFTDWFQEHGWNCWTLGTGTIQGGPVPGFSPPKTPPISRLHPEPLKEIASATGGKYYPLTNIGGTLRTILRELSRWKGEVATHQKIQWTVYKEYYPYLAMVSLAFLILWWGVLMGGMPAPAYVFTTPRNYFRWVNRWIHSELERMRRPFP